MAPVCQAEESLNAHFDDLLNRQIDAEVGVLVGRNGCAKRDLIGMAVPTPQQDNQAPIALQSSKTKASKKVGKQVQADQATLAIDCIVEHATQVAAMMPGGLMVVGMYLYGPEAIFTSVTQQLHRVLDGMATSPGMEADKLLFVSSPGRRFLCKHRPKGTGANATLPIYTFNLAPVLASMSCMTCRFHVSISSPCISNQKRLAEQLEAAASTECERIQQAIGIINGKVADAGSTVADLPSDGSQEMELLCMPATCSPSKSQHVQQDSISGRLLLTGVLYAKAVVSKRDTLAAAVDLIQADLVNSLQARLDIVLAEAEEDTASADVDSSKLSSLSSCSNHSLHAFSQPLPQRVVFPGKGSVTFTDYLATDELVTDAAARADNILGSGSISHSKVDCPEGTLCKFEQLQPSAVWAPSEQHQTRQTRASSCWTSWCNAALVASSAIVGLTALISMLYIGR